MLRFILNLLKLIVFAIVVFVVVVFIYGFIMGVTGHDKTSVKVASAPKIVSVENETEYINQNQQFSLPTTLPAKMSDQTGKAVPVIWDANVSTANAGTHTYVGTIQGYKDKVSYALTTLPNPQVTYFNDINVFNSMVKYNVPVDQDTLWIMLEVSKNDQSFEETLPAVNGIFTENLYLPFGAGLYSVIEDTSTADSEFGNNYYQQETFRINNLDTRDMTGLMPSQYVESDSQEIIKLANTITKASYSDYDKACAIDNWVTNNIAYDVKNENNTNLEYSALRTLHNRIATCNGYSNLYAALSRAVGLRTKVIGGKATPDKADKAGGHNWNESLVGNVWINIDTTWDSGGIDSSNTFVPDPESTYFNMSNSEFSKTHTKTSESDCSN